jgi:hypothetical protein
MDAAVAARGYTILGSVPLGDFGDRYVGCEKDGEYAILWQSRYGAVSKPRFDAALQRAVADIELALLFAMARAA